MSTTADQPATRTASVVLAEAMNGHTVGPDISRTALATGYEPLDEVLGGGLRSGELTVVGGPPGVGKTVLCLQWARSMASAGAAVTYVCYEHDHRELLYRLLLLELGSAVADSADAARAETLRAAVRHTIDGGWPLDGLPDDSGLLSAAIERFHFYAHRLTLVAASGRETSADAMERAFDTGSAEEPDVLLVDYLQKIPVEAGAASEYERHVVASQRLKDLALARALAVVAVSAVQHSGAATRFRLPHLRGADVLAYESDLVLMLNPKWQAVSRMHLAYDERSAESFRNWVVVTVEKNRRGPVPVDLEFRKQFETFRFDPEGRHVAERLVDGRVEGD